MVIDINEIISYIPSYGDPSGDWHQLSADVGFVKGNKRLWVFDVGADQEIVDYIIEQGKPFSAVISHFHPDHMLNLKNLPSGDIYMSKNTYKYYLRDYMNVMNCPQNIIIIEDDIFIDDGIKVHIFKLPSSHSKGSVAMEINDEFAFIGDGIYPAHKNGIEVYNQQLLIEQINLLNKIKSSQLLLSHKDKYIYDKIAILRLLEKIKEKTLELRKQR